MPSQPRRPPTARFSLGVVIAGWITLFFHGYFNAAYLTEFGTQYTDDWFRDPRFIIGLGIYAFGFAPVLLEVSRNLLD